MGGKLAGLGYAVLIPDVYYRNAGWAPFDPVTVFTTASRSPTTAPTTSRRPPVTARR